jgi:transposase
VSLSRAVALLFPHLAGVVLEGIEAYQGMLLLRVRDRPGPVPCPDCGQLSGRLNSWYQRRLADVPAGGQPVRIMVTARRLACGNQECGRKTFAAQIEGLTSRYARTTPPAADILAAAAVLLAGRAGAGLAAVLGITVSRFTLLRLVLAMPDPPAGEGVQSSV